MFGISTTVQPDLDTTETFLNFMEARSSDQVLEAIRHTAITGVIEGQLSRRQAVWLIETAVRDAIKRGVEPWVTTQF